MLEFVVQFVGLLCRLVRTTQNGSIRSIDGHLVWGRSLCRLLALIGMGWAMGRGVQAEESRIAWPVSATAASTAATAASSAPSTNLETPISRSSGQTSSDANDETPSVSPSGDVGLSTTAQELLEWVPAEKVTSSLHLAVSMTLLGLVPALLLMTTSYVRIAVVLSLLRQAFGIPNLLPMQATTALALFCTGWIMWPTWQLVHRDAVVPLMAGKATVQPEQLWNQGIDPIRQFMVRQIKANHNSDDIHLFLQRTVSEADYPQSYEEVPLAALLPAYLLSELKTAFVIGFQIYLPFLVIDLVVSALTTSMGLFMMPPNMISMPLKLLLFVLADGWHVVVEMLLNSFH